MESRRRMRVASKDSLAQGVVGLELEPADPESTLPQWRPGAHVDLHGPDGLVRQYSLCGAPEASSWRVGVLKVADGRGGSRWVHDQLEVGDLVEVAGPRNHFGLEVGDDHLFVAGGIGITPILPMLREVAQRDGARWRLVYGGRSRASMAFADELVERWPDHVQLVPQDVEGVLDLAAVFGEPSPGRVVHCCGPEPLLVAVEELLADRPEALHVERFVAEVDLAGEAFEVEIASAGARVTVEEGCSILDALADAGVVVESSCREGTCGTCETGVLGGVPDHRDSVLTDEEKAANDVMMVCVGRCLKGPLVLDL